jgi:agmatine/peptidylarginine deiminase
VLVPVFQQPADAQALAILQALMPGHRVVGIDGRWLVTQYGNIHCVTQQIPLAS